MPCLVCSCLQTVPVVVGVGVVVITAVLAKIFLFGNKKKKPPVTLKDPTVKYPLKLVDKEVPDMSCPVVFSL